MSSQSLIPCDLCAGDAGPPEDLIPLSACFGGGVGDPNISWTAGTTVVDIRASDGWVPAADAGWHAQVALGRFPSTSEDPFPAGRKGGGALAP